MRLLYFASIDPDNGMLDSLRMTPMRACRFRPERASQDDAGRMHIALQQTSEPFGTRLHQEADGTLTVTAR